jgi:hypothetical protein
LQFGTITLLKPNFLVVVAVDAKININSKINIDAKFNINAKIDIDTKIGGSQNQY